MWQCSLGHCSPTTALGRQVAGIPWVRTRATGRWPELPWKVSIHWGQWPRRSVGLDVCPGPRKPSHHWFSKVQIWVRKACYKHIHSWWPTWSTQWTDCLLRWPHPDPAMLMSVVTVPLSSSGKKALPKAASPRQAADIPRGLPGFSESADALLPTVNGLRWTSWALRASFHPLPTPAKTWDLDVGLGDSDPESLLVSLTPLLPTALSGFILYTMAFSVLLPPKFQSSLTLAPQHLASPVTDGLEHTSVPAQAHSLLRLPRPHPSRTGETFPIHALGDDFAPVHCLLESQFLFLFF